MTGVPVGGPQPETAATWEIESDARRRSPAAARNREPIAAVLADLLPSSGCVLEIASGTGEHIAHFAEAFPTLEWQPSDPEPSSLASIASWTSGLTNVSTPVAIDATEPGWPVERADAIYCANMIHIAPWDAALGLMAGASAVLASGAPLILYGPYLRGDVATAPSNLDFDGSLKARDARWGLRSVEDVRAAADVRGLAFERLIEMPANNLMLVFRKA